MIDSGCSQHMSYNRDLFRPGTMRADYSLVRCADGGTVRASARGTVDVGLTKGRTFALENVLYVPDLTQNLISVCYLQRHGYSVLFYGDRNTMSCQILRNNAIICTVPNLNGMWVVGGTAISRSTQATAYAALTLTDLHHRLGHASKEKLLYMLDKGQLSGITIIGPRNLDNCYGCSMGKQHRHHLVSDPDKPATQKLDLIHMDLMGPFPIPTKGGYKYVLTIIDDCSRFCWVILLQKKSDVFLNFLTWSTRIEREAKATISRIRVDNGGEFKNSNMVNLCAQRGYRQEFTNPYTPQQNGVAERYNRTLLDTVRSILTSANVPGHWWGDALQCANYMRNRSSHSSVKRKLSPYHKWSGRPPDVSKMHIFGCRVSVLVAKPKQVKLGPKAMEGLFFGYSESSTGYRILLPSEQIIESSDVIFYDSTILRRNYDHFYPTQTLSTPNLPEYPLPCASSTPSPHSPDPNPYSSPPASPDDDDDDEDPPSTPPDTLLVPSHPSLHSSPLPDLPHPFPDPPSPTVPTTLPSAPSVPTFPAIPNRPRRSTHPPRRLEYDTLGTPRYDHLALLTASTPDPPRSVPRGVKSALSGPDAAKWQAVIDDEISSINHHDTYTWKPLPPG